VLLFILLGYINKSSNKTLKEDIMTYLNETVQTGDWKGEKHVPAIEIKNAKKGEEVVVKVKVGEEIAHPNTFEHHIAWIKVFFLPEGAKLPVEVADFNFSAHGEGELFTDPAGYATFKTDKNGTVLAQSYCNIHGLWEDSIELKLED